MDTAQNTLILYRDITDPQTSAMRAYGVRTHSGFSAFPLKDFPGAQGINIWNVAATPDGEIVVCSILNYGKHRIKHVLLTYDSVGILRKVWDVFPHHQHEVAVDREGNVFAFGEQIDKPNDNYPLIVKYSPHGDVLREFLPAITFASGSDVVSANPKTGIHQMFVAGEELVLYLATTKDLFRFDLEGNIRQRISLAPVLSKIPADTGYDWSEILTLAPPKKGDDLFAQIRLWPKDPNTKKINFVMAQISRDGRSWEKQSPVTEIRYPGPFIGTNEQGKLLFLQKGANGEAHLFEYEKVPESP